jgi:hypothetical protein
MMEAVRTSETSVDIHFTRQYIPEDNSEQQYMDWTVFENHVLTNKFEFKRDKLGALRKFAQSRAS